MAYWKQIEQDKWHNPTPDHYYLAQIAREVYTGLTSIAYTISNIIRKKGSPASKQPPKFTLKDFLLSPDNEEPQHSTTPVKVKSVASKVIKERSRKEKQSGVKEVSVPNLTNRDNVFDEVISMTEDDIKLERGRQFTMQAYALMNMRTGLTQPYPDYLLTFEAWKQWRMTRSKK